MGVLYDALALDGLHLLVIGAVLAGLVRGFSGFGTAMVYMPFAAQVLPPVWALITLQVIEIIGPIPAVPRAIREGEPRDVARLAAGALVGTPVGVALLLAFSPDPFRFAVSGVTLLLLLLLVAGVRYHGRVGRGLIYATGGIGGVFGGAVGLPGPPVILLYMARPLPPQVIRANIMLYLILFDVMVIAVFGLRGLLQAAPIAVGVVVAPVYLAGVWLGAAIFDPAREKLYRWVAYAVIAGSALGGLPVWG